MPRSRVLLTLAALCAIAVALIAWQWPALKAAGRRALSRAYFEHGRKLVAAGDPAAGLEDFAKAIEADPSLADVYKERADLYFNAQDYTDARPDYAAYLRLMPGDIQARMNHAVTVRGIAGKAGPITDLNEVIRRDPRNVEAYQNRATLFMVLKDYGKALADFNEAVRLKPGFDNYYKRGIVNEALGRTGDALADYTNAFEKAGDDSDKWVALDKRAQLYLKTGDYAHALIDYLTATSLTTGDEESYNNCAWFLATCPDPACRDGKRALPFAIKACEATAWENPRDIDTLAAAYAETGDFEKAVNFQAWAIGMFTNTMWSSGAQSRLDLYKAHQPYHQPPKPPVL